MRLLLPPAADPVDPVAVVTGDARPAGPGRPWVLANMVSTIDGATAVDGVSGSLGGPDDRRMFAIIRSVADVVLVGAGTVRAEGYGPVRLADELRAARVARGQTPLPRLAIVTARLDLDPTAEVFAGEGPRPLVLTIDDAPAPARARLDEVAEVVALGTGRVDLGRALGWLRTDQGAAVVLSEGGPTLIGLLAAGGLLDEICWTVANAIAAGDSARLAHGEPVVPPLRLPLQRVLEADGTLFLRYARP